MTFRPEPTEPHRFIGVGGGHGWLYAVGEGLLIEHCIDGFWHCCPLAPVGLTLREAGRAAMRHVARRTGHGSEAVRLGHNFCHAGPNAFPHLSLTKTHEKTLPPVPTGCTVTTRATGDAGGDNHRRVQ